MRRLKCVIVRIIVYTYICTYNCYILYILRFITTFIIRVVIYVYMTFTRGLKCVLVSLIFVYDEIDGKYCMKLKRGVEIMWISMKTQITRRNRESSRANVEGLMLCRDSLIPHYCERTQWNSCRTSCWIGLFTLGAQRLLAELKIKPIDATLVWARWIGLTSVLGLLAQNE